MRVYSSRLDEIIFGKHLTGWQSLGVKKVEAKLLGRMGDKAEC